MGYISNERRRNFLVDLSSGQDFISTEPIDNQNYYGGSIGQWKQEKPEKRIQTFFFLDRAIYRPGQTIYFKGLVGKHGWTVIHHSSLNTAPPSTYWMSTINRGRESR